VNDDAQDKHTTFTLTDGKIPWNTTANGNGAVVFEFADDEITDSDLTEALPAPVTGAKPVMEIKEGRYTGKVAWTDTATGKAPVYFKGETVYAATITDLVANTDFYFSTDGVTVTHGDSSRISYAPDGKVGVVFLKTGAFWEYDGSFSGSSTVGGEMDSAIDIIRQAKNEGWSSLSLKLFPWPETVDLNTSGTDISGGLVLKAGDNSPASVTLDGGGKTIPLPQTGTFTASVITVGNGVTLTLKNITFKGNIGSKQNEKPLIIVETGGTLVLEDGAVITGHYNDKKNFGSGVYVNGGSFIMNDGEISGNTGKNGSAVYVENGTFTMNNGVISGNTASTFLGGGVYLSSNTSIQAWL
jgi:hypothetical protein